MARDLREKKKQFNAKAQSARRTAQPWVNNRNGKETAGVQKGRQDELRQVETDRVEGRGRKEKRFHAKGMRRQQREGNGRKGRRSAANDVRRQKKQKKRFHAKGMRKGREG